MTVRQDEWGFFVRWRENEKQIRKTFPTREEAEEFDRQTQARLYRHAVVRRISSVSKSIEHFVSEWLASLPVAPITRSSYERSVFKPFIEYFQGRYIQTLNLIDLNRYFDQRKNQVKPSTVRKEFSIIRYFFSCMTELLLLPSDPMRKIKVDHVRKSPGIALSYLQEYRLLQAVTSYQRSKILLALDAGLRAKNIGLINRGQINFEEKTLIFHVLKKRVRSLADAETRTLPMTKRLSESMSQFEDYPRERLLFTYAGRSLQDPDKFLKRLRPRLGFYFRWHDLRHTFYTKLLEACDNTALAEWSLGHSITYWHPRLEKLQQSFQAMELRTEDAFQEISLGLEEVKQ